jgi:hypothetical protein
MKSKMAHLLGLAWLVWLTGCATEEPQVIPSQEPCLPDTVIATTAVNIATSATNTASPKTAGSPMPEYLSLVWPYPDSSVTLDCYSRSLKSVFPRNRGVGVEISVWEIDANFSNWAPMHDRVKIYLDDNALDDSTVTSTETDELLDEIGKSYPTSVPGLITMSWAPPLGLGTHKATIKITRDTGEILEFSWKFQITSTK